ncbi:MAG: hypothetical protein ACREKR_05690 [Candidatus Methylomirabilales bacterium]
MIHEAKPPIFTVIFATGILLGMIVNQALNAQQAPLKVIELLKTDVAGMKDARWTP